MTTAEKPLCRICGQLCVCVGGLSGCSGPSYTLRDAEGQEVRVPIYVAERLRAHYLGTARGAPQAGGVPNDRQVPPLGSWVERAPGFNGKGCCDVVTAGGLSPRQVTRTCPESRPCVLEFQLFYAESRRYCAECARMFVNALPGSGVLWGG